MALTSSELASIRSDLEQTLSETCVIQRRTLASDGQGGQTETWAAAGTVSCRRGPRQSTQGAETAVGGRVVADGQWTITLPADTVVTEKDRLLIDGTTYEPTTVQGGRSNELFRRVIATRST